MIWFWIHYGIVKWKSIDYNYLNLPVKINLIDNNNFINVLYQYDATGNKRVKQTRINGRIIKTTNYIGNFVYENGLFKYLLTSVGRIEPIAGEMVYQYFIKDHLGNNRVLFDQDNQIIQQNNYYPFGMLITDKRSPDAFYDYNRYLNNGKELQDDFGLDWYDYGARFYDAQLVRWHVVDPLAEVAYDWTPYRYGYNNPMKYTDPTGMLESTHTDEDGVVLRVEDDRDNGVYKHAGKGAEAKKNIDANYSADNTSAGGDKMGESLHSLSFADQSLYNETGEVQAADIKIDYGSSELTDKVQGILDADPSLIEYAGKAGTNGDWDLKSNTANGSKLFGKYSSPRDAGNFAAGAVAQKSSLTGIAQFGYGAYNLSGNSKGKIGLITGAVGALTLVNPALGLGAGYLIGKFGEDKLSQRSIDIGKQYIKNK